MADPFISYLRLAGWKSFRQAEVRFGAVNVLIGSNGSGKSGLLSFFGMFRRLLDGTLHDYFATHGRADRVLHFGPRHTERLAFELQRWARKDTAYEAVLRPTPDGLLLFESELCGGLPKVPVQDSNRTADPLSRMNVESRLLALPGIRDTFFDPRGLRLYQFHDTSVHSRIRGFAKVGQANYLHEDAGNLAAILFRLRQETPAIYREIERQVRHGIPGFSRFQLEPLQGREPELRLEWLGAESDYPMTPHQLSDGSLRWIALCTLLLQPAEWRPGLILIDEPELGLHPALLERFATIVHSASEQTQIILATQSPFLLNFFEPEEIITIDHDGRESTIRRHDRESLAGWLRDYSLGELWEKNVLGGQPIG